MDKIFKIYYPHALLGKKPHERKVYNYYYLNSTYVNLKDISDGNNIKKVATISNLRKHEIFQNKQEYENHVPFDYYRDESGNFYFTTPNLTINAIEELFETQRFKAENNIGQILEKMNQKEKIPYNFGSEIADESDLRIVEQDKGRESKRTLLETMSGIYVDGNNVLLPCSEPLFFVKNNDTVSYGENIDTLDSLFFPFHNYNSNDFDNYNVNRIMENAVPIIYKELFEKRLSENYTMSRIKESTDERYCDELQYSIYEPEVFMVNPNLFFHDKIKNKNIYNIDFKKMNDDIYFLLKEFDSFINTMKKLNIEDDSLQNLEDYYDKLNKAFYIKNPKEKEMYFSKKMFEDFKNLIEEYKTIQNTNFSVKFEPEKFLLEENQTNFRI